MTRKIYGQIQSEWGIPPEFQVRVMVWDADFDDDDHIGSAMVDQYGNYQIEFTDEKWDWSPIGSITRWRPDVYIVVEVFDENTQMWKELARSKVYSDLDVREDQEINLYVNFSYTYSNTIYGSIKTAGGEPLIEHVVSAWDEKKSILGMQTKTETSQAISDTGLMEPASYIGSSKTNKEGQYRIMYDPSKFAMSLDRLMREGLDAWRRPDIFIKVHNPDGKGVLHRSPTKLNVICQLGCRIDVNL
jgi:hypothetical protein